MPPDQATRLPIARIVVWAIVLLIGLGWFGRSLVGYFRPVANEYPDFVQEWLSAKNFFANAPVYEDQSSAFTRHRPGSSVPSNFFRYNAHPPAAVLVALPFAHFDYHEAHLAWNGCTFILFLAAVVLAVRELAGANGWWTLLPAISVVVWAEPVRATLAYGQLNFLLAALLTFGWVADRRGHQILAGVLVGAAAGIKLFPGLILVYFLFAGRWRAAAAMAISAVAVNGLALALFGVGTFETYVRDVMPSLADFQRGWRNLSLNGFVLKLFNPHPDQIGDEVVRYPQAAKIVAGVAALSVVAGVVWSGWRAGRTGDPDRGWAVAVVGMLLASPIAWTHYFVLLVVPLGVLASRLSPSPLRWIGWGVVVGMCVPDVLYWVVSVSAEHRKAKPSSHHIPLSVKESLTGVAVPCYLTVVLFGLTLLVGKARGFTPASPPSPSSAGTPAPSPAPGP